MTNKPKPLVQVFRGRNETWEYFCMRCLGGGWDRTWSATIDRATSHAGSHNNVGFRSKGR